MKGDARRRFRVIAPRSEVFPVVASFLIPQAALFALEWVAPIQFAAFRGQIGAFVLVVAAAYHGGVRVASSHPCFDKDYATWLESVPWTNRKPLPFAPIPIVWEDAVVVGMLILAAAILPVTIAPWLVVAWLMASLAALCISFILTRTTVFCYPTLLGAGFAVLTLRRPYLSIAILVATYAIAHRGLKRALDAFPWAPRRNFLTAQSVHDFVGPRGHAGWPYERMLGQVVGARGLSRPDVILSTLLAAFWLYALSSLIPDPTLRLNLGLVVFSMSLWIVPLIRVGIYAGNQASPMSFLGRLVTFCWIIPRYDVVFATPICSGIAGLAVFFGLRPFTPPEILGPTAASVVVLIALLGPPSLRRWRLTGGHRITNGLANNKRDFVEAG